MAIKVTKAIPAYMMQYLLIDGPPSANMREFVGKYDDVWIVSITDPEHTVFDKDTDHIVRFQFHDSSPESPKREQELIADGHILFSDKMADKLVKFIVHANEANGPDSNDLLFVNCMMGVSRSGAVIDFARQIFGLDYDSFKKMNPQIIPNQFVKTKLVKAYQNLVNSFHTK